MRHPHAWILAFATVVLGCAVGSAPRRENAIDDAAAAYAAQGRLVEAVREAEVSARIHPDDAALQKQAGLLRARIGSFDAAAVHLESAARLAPDDASTWGALGKVDAECGDVTGSYVAYRRAVQLAPDDTALRAALLEAAARVGLPVEARVKPVPEPAPPAAPAGAEGD